MMKPPAATSHGETDGPFWGGTTLARVAIFTKIQVPIASMTGAHQGAPIKASKPAPNV